MKRKNVKFNLILLLLIIHFRFCPIQVKSLQVIFFIVKRSKTEMNNHFNREHRNSSYFN